MSEKNPSSGRQWIKNWPESERPREKLSLFGPEALSDGELLAVLLRIGKAGQSAEDLGRQLLTQFDGIIGIDRAHMEELLAVRSAARQSGGVKSSYARIYHMEKVMRTYLEEINS